MCGICGIFNKKSNPIDQILLGQMMSTLLHRGPDGQGKYVDGEIGLGHRRLSIIDLEGGAQPIGNEDGSLQIVFNGEIYNYLELRNELLAKGHHFQTQSDTEVIVHAFEQWGKECVLHFNGMFAFALWDTFRRELFIARDHLGIKPLYYSDLSNRFIFASEIKALLQDKDCPKETDIESLTELVTFRYVPSPNTMFKGIKKLPPGHRMTISIKGITVERYWNWVPNIRKNINENSLIEEYQILLEDAIKLQMRSDVPLGLFLSSGIDSGALLAVMSQYSYGPVQAFTVGFEGGEDTNEIDDANVLARMFNAKHYSINISPEDYLKYYEKYLWDIEEPLGNESAAAFYFVSKITSGHVKVALTGQGADEPWAGYDRYLGVKLSTYYSRVPPILSHGINILLQSIPGRFEKLKRGSSSLYERDILTRFTKIYSFFSEEMKQQLFKDNLKFQHNVAASGPRNSIRRLQSDVQHLDPISQMLYIDTRANLSDDLLMVGDKTSMANSLEARVPYLDYRLIEFIESLPSSLKLKGFTGKYLHKKALEKWLPKSIIYKKKKGFINPIEHWFRTSLKSFVEECLLAPDSSMSQFFDQKFIRLMINKDLAGKEQYKRHIYLLVSFELWYRTFMRN